MPSLRSWILLSEALGLAERARSCGVETQLEVLDAMRRVRPFVAGNGPEGRGAIDRVGAFLRKRQETVE